MTARIHNHSAALRFIFITMLLDMLAFGIIVPVLPRLIASLLNGDTAKASMAIGLFATAWALMQFIFSPLLGLLSDRYGRRTVILLSNFGLGIDYIIMALAPTLGWLFAGRLISGITAASMTTANAYISDITTPEKRSRAYGLMSSAFGVGFIMGPAIGGWLGGIDPRLPFWFASGCSLLNALYGFLVLPESLPAERRKKTLNWTKANPLGALKLLRSHPELLGLSGITFIQNLAHEVYPTVFVLYAMTRYGWDQRAVGLALAIVGISSIAISAGVVGPAVKKLGEYNALFTGLALGGIGFALFGWAGTGMVFLAAIPINSLWGLAGPPGQTLMTKLVSPAEQGELQGAIACLRGIAMLIGPGIFSSVYAVYVVSEPGAPWYLAALLLLMAMMLTSVVLRKLQIVKGRSEVSEPS